MGSRRWSYLASLPGIVIKAHVIISPVQPSSLLATRRVPPVRLQYVLPSGDLLNICAAYGEIIDPMTGSLRATVSPLYDIW